MRSGGYLLPTDQFSSGIYRENKTKMRNLGTFSIPTNPVPIIRASIARYITIHFYLPTIPPPPRRRRKTITLQSIGIG